MKFYTAINFFQRRIADTGRDIFVIFTRFLKYTNPSGIDKIEPILAPILVMFNPLPAAIAGSKKLVAYFTTAAGKAGCYFLAGPVWNASDRLLDGKIQFLRFHFRDAEPNEICFSLEQLTEYGAGNGPASEVVECKIRALFTTTS